MKVRDLRRLLDNYHDESIVCLSSDPEGNKYWHVAGVGEFPVYEQDGEDYYRTEVPDDIYANSVVMIWPG